jgi:hypothetical protein
MAPPRKKQKTSKKAKAANWFEKCTVDQLKQLCKASLLQVSGSKPKLVERLIQGDISSRFENGGDGTESLKSECREKGLVVSGTLFELILRLLTNETCSQTGVEPKKAQGTFDPESGKFQPKVRAKSMKLPDPEKLSERMHKKAYPPQKVMWSWSNWTSKQHCYRCMSLTTELLQKEVIDKNLFERGEEELAWQVVTELVRWWLYTNGEIGRRGGPVRGMGYCSSEVSELNEIHLKFVKQTKEKEKLVEWGVERLLRDLHAEAGDYGANEEGFSQKLDQCFLEKDNESTATGSTAGESNEDA